MNKLVKNITAAALTLAMITSAAACGTSAKETTAAETTTAETTVEETTAAETTAAETVEETTAGEIGAMVGGWTINEEEPTAMLPDEVQEVFDKAMEGYTGMSFTPIAYLGSQVVAGTNYMILCKGTTVTADPEDKLVVVTVYADLDGNAEITNAVDFDLGEHSQDSNESDSEQLEGGWTMYTDQAAIDLTADEDNALSTAVDNLYVDDDSTTVEPLFCLGTQVVSGTNYAFLCRKNVLPTGDGAEMVSTLCVYYVYAPIDGDAEVSNIYNINLADFNQ